MAVFSNPMVFSRHPILLDVPLRPPETFRNRNGLICARIRSQINVIIQLFIFFLRSQFSALDVRSFPPTAKYVASCRWRHPRRRCYRFSETSEPTALRDLLSRRQDRIRKAYFELRPEGKRITFNEIDLERIDTWELFALSPRPNECLKPFYHHVPDRTCVLKTAWFRTLLYRNPGRRDETWSWS